jgi:hypothetical protein
MNCSVWFGLVFVEYDWLLIKTSQGQPALPCVMERVCKSGEMRYEETKAIQITREQCELSTPFPPSTPFSSSLHPIDLIPNVKDIDFFHSNHVYVHKATKKDQHWECN